MSFKLLKQMCEISSPSGSEFKMKEFILDYIKSNKNTWRVSPYILQGSNMQDCVGLVFGNPRIAVFAHIDTVGFMVRYQNQLVPIGSPEIKEGISIVGTDSLGPIACELKIDQEGRISADFQRGIDTGTVLTFNPDFQESDLYIQSPYLDNRVGVWNALKLAENIENGIIFFTCWEEHGGGSAGYLAKRMFEDYGVSQALISDVTWVTDGVLSGNGTVISLKDQHLPRRSFINKIVDLAIKHQIEFQLEVEDEGSSDGGEIQKMPYPIDWCFIGPPEKNVHSPNEKIHKKDILSTLEFYRVLTDEL